MSKDIAAIDILAEARRLIDEVGWCQGTFEKHGPNGVVGYCQSGARCEARRRLGSDSDSYWVAFDVSRVAFQNAVGRRDLFEFNDAPERTKQEVLAAFDRAMELLHP